MKTAELMCLVGVSKATIYRWMEKHPSAKTRSSISLLGHPFPRPIEKDGVEVIWDGDAVEAWFSANKEIVGRHPIRNMTIPKNIFFNHFHPEIWDEMKSMQKNDDNTMEVVFFSASSVIKYQSRMEDIARENS